MLIQPADPIHRPSFLRRGIRFRLKSLMTAIAVFALLLAMWRAYVLFPSYPSELRKKDKFTKLINPTSFQDLDYWRRVFKLPESKPSATTRPESSAYP
jgi:hypothetical protein